jgi:hypothetical protein
MAKKTNIKRKRTAKKNKTKRQPNRDAEALEPAVTYVPAIPT